MDCLWALLDVLMVWMLMSVEGCEVFWLIQTLQALELVPWACGWSFGTWMQFDILNIILEAACLACLKKMPFVWVLMAVHVGLKLALYRNIDMPWQYRLGGMQVWAYWVNNLTILAIIAYTRPIPRLRDLGVKCLMIQSIHP